MRPLDPSLEARTMDPRRRMLSEWKTLELACRMGKARVDGWGSDQVFIGLLGRDAPIVSEDEHWRP